MPFGQNCVKTVQAPCNPLSAPINVPHGCPICSAQLNVTNVPVRHNDKGKRTVPAFTCTNGHMLMQCFNNKDHTDLWECKTNHQGKIVHRCKRCPKNKQKSVLCDHCFARFEANSGASSFHPKEDCPHYLKKNPHVIKHSHLRKWNVLMAAGVLRKLCHPMYTTERNEILLELGAHDAICRNMLAV